MNEDNIMKDQMRGKERENRSINLIQYLKMIICYTVEDFEWTTTQKRN